MRASQRPPDAGHVLNGRHRPPQAASNTHAKLRQQKNAKTHLKPPSCCSPSDDVGVLALQNLVQLGGERLTPAAQFLDSERECVREGGG